LIIPVEISVYEDRVTLSFLKHLLPLYYWLKIKKGSATPNRVSGIYNKAQLEEIANIKLPDLNTTKVSSAMKIVEELPTWVYPL
jgi:large subunit ribosomal protein L11